MMKFLKGSSKNILYPNLKIVAFPLISIVTVFFLFIFTYRFSYPRIQKERREIEESKITIGLLEEKLDILTTIKEKILSDSDISLLAVPSQDPSIWVFYQINNQVLEEALVLMHRNAKGTTSYGSLQSSDVEFGFQGDLISVINYLESLFEIAPLTSVEDVQMEVGGGVVAEGRVTISSVFADLPTKIPKIAEPIKNLTDEENKLLVELSELKKPEFTTLDPSSEEKRKDPFN